MKGKIIVAGGTGLIGRTLVRELADRGYEVVLLTRGSLPAALARPGVRAARWDGEKLGDWAVEFESAKAVINLCGAGIADERWTEARKQELLGSRIHPLQALVQASVRCADPPKTILTASAVGYYGDAAPDQTVTESRPRGSGYLSELCSQWEKAAQTAEPFGIRVIYLRFGIVLSTEGGALAKFVPPFRAGIGGPLGSGRQILPWIHREDAVGAVVHALEHRDLSGPVNVVSPHPVSMKDFCSALGRVMKRPSWLPVPAFVLRSLMGEAARVVLEGQRALPRKLMDAGFKFKHPEVEKALQDILENQK